MEERHRRKAKNLKSETVRKTVSEGNIIRARKTRSTSERSRRRKDKKKEKEEEEEEGE
jgi:hypothetical protein